jgi:hypothetical protein
MTASVNWGGGNLLIAMGYRRAGDLLVNEVARDRGEADALVYPIVFCYRQCIELLLKETLAEAHRYYDVRDDYPDEHSLVALWTLLRPHLERRFADEPESAIPHVEDQLARFDAVDPGSYAFRYATGTKPKKKTAAKRREPSLPPDLQRINLPNLAEVTERLAIFLESTITLLDAERQAADDGYYGEP